MIQPYVPRSAAATCPQALHTHGRRLRVSMEGENSAMLPTSPGRSSPRAADGGGGFHSLQQRTSWEQQRNRSFDSARGRAQVGCACLPC